MRSVSGVRGIVGTDITPAIVARYARAFGRLLEPGGRSVVLARDSRQSGPEFAAAARQGLHAAGVGVIDCGLVPTPTAQLAVEHHGAAGGLIITASHNPIEWNALKFVGADGLFLPPGRLEQLFATVDAGGAPSVDERFMGEIVAQVKRSPVDDPEAIERHLAAVLALDVVDVEAVRHHGFTVALDCVRGAGGAIMPELLERLGCTVVGMSLETDGRFPRSPEPVPANLGELAALVQASGADLGMAVDPDVDRLALVDETGAPIGEDYTLAFAVRSVLERRAGPVVVNLSTSLVVDDAARPFGIGVERVPVGEANVARAMREREAAVGGEGNGGVILPALHLGRDAPVAAALVLDLVARHRGVSALVDGQPRYAIVKAKAPRASDLTPVYRALERRFADAAVDRQDGLRLAWADRWLHVRPSGTEPIVRLIAEAPTEEAAAELIAGAEAALRP